MGRAPGESAPEEPAPGHGNGDVRTGTGRGRSAFGAGGPARWLAALVAVAVVAGLLLLLLVLPRLRTLVPRLTSEEASELAMATLQRESRESFVITGALQMTVQTRVGNVRRLLPGVLDMSLGTVESTVRAPGRVSYGFRVDELSRASFRVMGDTIQMEVPPVRVYSVEPALHEMDVRTTAGWLRARASTQSDVQQRATALVSDALRAQAEAHLRSAEQPAINTAHTLAELLRPAFQAQGMADPVFRFLLGDGLTYTSDRPHRR
jgi:hypothetical protein